MRAEDRHHPGHRRGREQRARYRRPDNLEREAKKSMTKPDVDADVDGHRNIAADGRTTHTDLRDQDQVDYGVEDEHAD